MSRILNKLESLINSKPYCRERAKTVLTAAGLIGTFEVRWRTNEYSMSWQQDIPKGIVFQDSKMQFLYELKGGDDYFIPIIDSRDELNITDSPGPL